jgi:hypothetical protein
VGAVFDGQLRSSPYAGRETIVGRANVPHDKVGVAICQYYNIPLEELPDWFFMTRPCRG